MPKQNNKIITQTKIPTKTQQTTNKQHKPQNPLEVQTLV
jgi:hypothetical protein